MLVRFQVILVVSTKALCHDITCELILGSPPPFSFFVGAREEPGNEASHASPFTNTVHRSPSENIIIFIVYFLAVPYKLYL